MLTWLRSGLPFRAPRHGPRCDPEQCDRFSAWRVSTGIGLAGDPVVGNARETPTLRNMDDRSDAEIVAEVRAGNRAAFGQLVDRYQDRMMAYAVHMGCDSDEAADVVQDGMVRAYRHLARCGDPARFAGWLFRIVANVCRTRLRRRGRYRTVEIHGLESGLPANGRSPEALAEVSSMRLDVSAALSRVPPDQREALVLKYLQGLSLSQMMDLTGASASALKMRLMRGREALKVELAPLFETVAES